MIGIGIRVYSNSTIYYTVIDYSQENEELVFKTVDSINVPLAMDKPEQLNYVRNTILDLMSVYNVERAAIRLAEAGGAPRKGNGGIKQTTLDRCYFEGVIQESFANSSVKKYIAGPISKLSSVLTERTDFKKYAEGQIDFEFLPPQLVWQELSVEVRESILACYSAIHIN